MRWRARARAAGLVSRRRRRVPLLLDVTSCRSKIADASVVSSKLLLRSSGGNGTCTQRHGAVGPSLGSWRQVVHWKRSAMCVSKTRVATPFSTTWSSMLPSPTSMCATRLVSSSMALSKSVSSSCASCCTVWPDMWLASGRPVSTRFASRTAGVSFDVRSWRSSLKSGDIRAPRTGPSSCSASTRGLQPDIAWTTAEK